MAWTFDTTAQPDVDVLNGNAGDTRDHMTCDRCAATWGTDRCYGQVDTLRAGGWSLDVDQSDARDTRGDLCPDCARGTDRVVGLTRAQHMARRDHDGLVSHGADMDPTVWY